MAEELKQNTAIDVLVGQLIDPSDGLTPVTFLTLGTINCDLYKGTTKTDITLVAAGGGTGANRNFVHVAAGVWKLSLIAGDVATLGPMAIFFDDATQIVPTWEEFNVVALEAATLAGYLAEIRERLAGKAVYNRTTRKLTVYAADGVTVLLELQVSDPDTTHTQVVRV